MATIDRLYGTGIDSPIETTRPVGFNWPSNLPEVIAYKNGDKWSCNLQPEDLMDTTIYTQTIYVDGSTTGGGNDANSGLTWALRKLTINGALIAASASGIPTRILVYTNKGSINYTRDRCWVPGGTAFVSAVPMLVEAFDGRAVVGIFDSHTYTLTLAATYTYQVARAAAYRVFNPSIKDQNGLYKEYTFAASQAAVETTEGSWWTDNTTVFVHPHGNGLATNQNVRIYLSIKGAGWNCNQNLLVRNIDFEGGSQAAFTAMGGSTNTIITDNCTFRYGASSNTYTGGTFVCDSVMISGCKLFAAFNCQADNSSKDGFNFAPEGANTPSALLVNCSARFNGLSPSTSNNGFTCHNGVIAIDIGCDWVANRGGNSYHVTSTQNWSVGSVAGDSIGDVLLGGAQDWAAFGTQGGELWLDSCRDTGAVIGVYSGTDGAVNLRNHKGFGSHSGVGTISEY